MGNLISAEHNTTQTVCVYVCIYIYVCVLVGVYVCVGVCVWVWVCGCVCGCVGVCGCGCVCVGVCVCDLENSTMRRPRPELGCSATEKQN